jgi:hypothetical protein
MHRPTAATVATLVYTMLCGCKEEDLPIGELAGLGSSSGARAMAGRNGFVGGSGRAAAGGIAGASGEAPHGDGDAAHGGGGSQATGGGAAAGDTQTASGGTGAAAAGATSSGGTGEGSGGRAPDAPRTGPFKMLVLSITIEFRTDAIPAGQTLVAQIAAEQGFAVDFITSSYLPQADQITPESLAPYEAVMFLDSSGNFLSDAQHQAFEEWITAKQGAFVVVGGWSLQAERKWPFFEELAGMRADNNFIAAEADILWRPDALDFVAVKGLPSPWPMMDLWWHVTGYPDSPVKPGVKILATVDAPQSSNRPTQNTAVSWIRDWGNGRSFCTTLGHEKQSFLDAPFKRHLAAGIMWAARRDALLVSNP